MSYQQALQILKDFKREHFNNKPWSSSVVMCNLVRKWNDPHEPWYVRVYVLAPAPQDLDIPQLYRGLRIEITAFGTRS